MHVYTQSGDVLKRLLIFAELVMCSSMKCVVSCAASLRSTVKDCCQLFAINKHFVGDAVTCTVIDNNKNAVAGHATSLVELCFKNV